ncbi:MAG: hypothetical protein ACK4I8_01650, partial [Armatimonadota bacterium]
VVLLHDRKIGKFRLTRKFALQERKFSLAHKDVRPPSGKNFWLMGGRGSCRAITSVACKK